MASSDPWIRQAVIVGLKANGGRVRAGSLGEARQVLGLSDVSNSCFDAAVGSLCYKHGQIDWVRSWSDDPTAQARDHIFALR